VSHAGRPGGGKRSEAATRLATRKPGDYAADAENQDINVDPEYAEPALRIIDRLCRNKVSRGRDREVRS
jgi:hypothetical protein